MTDQIPRLCEVSVYVEQRRNIFDLRTFIAFKRRHKQRLMDRKALYLIEGRELVDPLQFDQVVIDVGHKQAKAGL